MTRKFVAAAAAFAAALAAAGPAEAAGKGCDPIARGHCLLPFPNDFHTVKRRGARRPAGGSPCRARRCRATRTACGSTRASGTALTASAPGQQITVRIPGLDTVAAAKRNRLVPITDIARSLDKRQRVVLIDARTGKRQLIWAEVDSAAPRAARRALLIRPGEEPRARGGATSSRCATCGPRAASGSSRRTLFRFYRDRRMTGSAAVERRRPAMERIFAALGRAGVGRRKLVLAWDFTVASRASLAGPMLRIRDAAFARSGTRTSPTSRPRAARRRSRSSRTS